MQCSHYSAAIFPEAPCQQQIYIFLYQEQNPPLPQLLQLPTTSFEYFYHCTDFPGCSGILYYSPPATKANPPSAPNAPTSTQPAVLPSAPRYTPLPAHNSRPSPPAPTG